MIPDIYQDQPIQVDSCLDIYNMFVQPFESSLTRKKIWKDFKKLITYIKNFNFLHHLDCIYLNGEFISQNANPDVMNILLKFNFGSILSEYEEVDYFDEWQDDLYEFSSSLLKNICLTTTFSNIDSSNPDFQKLHDFSESLTQLLLTEYTKVPGEQHRSKIFLILNRFDL